MTFLYGTTSTKKDDYELLLLIQYQHYLLPGNPNYYCYYKIAKAWMASNFHTSSPEIFTVVRPCILGCWESEWKAEKRFKILV